MRGALDALALTARYGTQVSALSLVAGLAVPPLAAAARPLLGSCIFLFVALTFLRADPILIRGVLGRPGRLGFACLWLLLAPAALIGFGLALIGRAALDPGLVLGLAIVAASPPLLSAPTIAALLGIEPSLLLSATVATTLVSPAIAPLIADAVAGAAVPLDPAALMLRLAALIGSAVIVALLGRRLIGVERLAARRSSIDGAGVVVYLVFGVAAMDGVTASAIARPWLVAGFLAVAFGVSLACFAATWAGLAWLKRQDRLMFGYGCGHRNMGVLIAALGTSVPETTFLFFALAQFPIYLVPQLLKAAVPRLLPRPDRAPVAGP